jgi:peptidoglycan hydrolase-like protein with peptidoglycan-binding domain
MHRRRLAVGVVGAVAVAAVIGVALVAGSDDSGSADSGAKTSETLQPVAARTLEDTTDVSGTIGYGPTTTVELTASAPSGGATGAADTGSGTITALPAVGTVIQPGQSLSEVDGVPSAFLMVGTRPMWRTLAAGVAAGPDVAQLEQTLRDLGYGGSITVDENFTSGTTSAIKAWQKAVGIEQTGTVTPAQVVFLPGAVRVASQIATVGSTANGKALTVTGTTPLVHVDLEAANVAYARQGDTVKIELPDGSTVDGTILSVGAATTTTSDAQGGGGGGTTTTVGVDIAVPTGNIAAFDGATAVVHLVTTKADNAVSVPVKSLLALAEGGYAVERVRNGRHQLVAVKPGAFAGGFVQVAGNVRAGDRVVTP